MAGYAIAALRGTAGLNAGWQTLLASLQAARVWIPLAIALAAAAATRLLDRTLPFRLARTETQGAAALVSMLAVVTPDAVVEERQRLKKLRATIQALATQGNDTVALLDTLLYEAIALAASDIHIEPAADKTTLCVRLHGALEPIADTSRESHLLLINRLKVLSSLVSYVSDRPQDGRLVANGPAGPTDVRVSLLPTHYGEKAVLRVARAASGILDLASLGLSPEATGRITSALSHAQGLIFVTGPTGSGKTSTLYGCLGNIKKLRGQRTQIASIEDPIELSLPFVAQTQVRPEVGLTFAAGLRAVLRQDPNVLMVGEIRDAETAHIAVQAGMSGHLILTTVHAPSACGVFNRVIEIGVEPFSLASATLLSVSQRLVRGLCSFCRVPTTPTPAEHAVLSSHGLQITGQVYSAPGCDLCDGQGYLGQRAIVEVMPMTPELRDLIIEKVPTPRLHAEARNQGLWSLFQDGLARAQQGLTTLAEVIRVAD